MHRGVVSCLPSTSGIAVARTMVAHRIHCVVVQTGDAPRIVTDAEMAATVFAGTLDSVTANELARPAPVLRPSDSLALAVERMNQQRTTHGVVLGPSLQLLGVVSILDVIERVLEEVEG